MKNYRYVIEYYSQNNDETNTIVKEALNNAWLNTPSKNNFMNYKVHVLGPDKQALKEMLYWKSLQQETKANNKPKTGEELKKYEKEKYIDHNILPQFNNLRTAPYVFIFTTRVCKEINKWQQHLVKNGYVYEQMATSGDRREAASKSARIEIGMFAANFSSEILEKGLDVSFTLCLPGNKTKYLEPEFSFLDEHPIFFMTAGKGKTYRRDRIPAATSSDGRADPKPDFDKIVNIV
jgi:glutaredoxin